MRQKTLSTYNTINMGEENNMRIQEYMNPYFTPFFHYEVPLNSTGLICEIFLCQYVGAFQWKLFKFYITLCSQSHLKLIMMKRVMISFLYEDLGSWQLLPNLVLRSGCTFLGKSFSLRKVTMILVGRELFTCRKFCFYY